MRSGLHTRLPTSEMRRCTRSISSATRPWGRQTSVSETPIAYLGPAGTWSEAAALLYGGATASLLPLTSPGGVVSAVETGLAGTGVLAIENSLEGAVGTTLDLLIHETKLRIMA